MLREEKILPKDQEKKWEQDVYDAYTNLRKKRVEEIDLNNGEGVNEYFFQNCIEVT